MRLYRTIPMGMYRPHLHVGQYTRAQVVYICIINTDPMSIVSVASMSVVNVYTDILRMKNRFSYEMLKYYIEFYTLKCETADRSLIFDIIRYKLKKSIINLCSRDIQCDLIIETAMGSHPYALKVVLKSVPSEYIYNEDLLLHVIARGYTQCLQVLIRRLHTHIFILSHAIVSNRLDYVNLILDAGRITKSDSYALLKLARRKKRYLIVKELRSWFENE